MDKLTIKTAKFRFLARHLAETTGSTEGLLAVALEAEALGEEILAELAAGES